MANRKLEKAKEIIGKKVVIGLSYYDNEGNLIDSEEMHGKVAIVNPSSVRVDLEGLHKGEIISLPRDLRAFKKAEPGTYTLKSTGEKVEDPDYTTIWSITSPKP